MKSIPESVGRAAVAAPLSSNQKRFEDFADAFGRIRLKDVPREGKGLLPCSRRTLTVWVRGLPPGRRLRTEGSSHIRWTRPAWLQSFLERQSREASGRVA
jgi:hypothetical protein